MKNRVPKLNQKELNKFIEVLGVKGVKMLFCDDMIKLTSQQLDYICSYGKEKEDKKHFKRR